MFDVHLFTMQIDHVNLVVLHLETMTAFYRDVLGLAVTKHVTISGAWIGAVVGLGARGGPQVVAALAPFAVTAEVQDEPVGRERNARLARRSAQ